MKISIFSVNDIQLMLNNDDKQLFEAIEALAAVSLNPNVTWIKFVLLDDKPNFNKQRIPKEEFSNILKTGLYMPIKMALGEISEGHPNTFPLGVITHLVEKGDKIEALAALWLREREGDVTLLKDLFENEKDINLSWEITYEKEMPQDGFSDLLGVSMNAATIVGMPAYLGRTSVQALASMNEEMYDDVAAVWTTAYVNDLPDSAFLYVEDGGKKDEEGKTVPRSLRHLPYKNKEGEVDAPHLRNAIARAPQIKGISPEKAAQLQQKARNILSKIQKASLEDDEIMDTIFVTEHEKALSELKAAHEKELETLRTEVSTLKSEQETLSGKFSTLETEAAQLREFKAGIDAEKERVRRLVEIKEKFAAAKITVAEDYFEAKAEVLLAMTDEQLDFFLQELAAFKPESTASVVIGTRNAPSFRGKPEEEVGKEAVLEFLGNLDKKR